VVVYGNLSTGFEAPTLGEVRLPAGFNEEVRPQIATSAEAGVRGDRGPFSYDVAIYRMGVDDEILPATIDNVTVYRNVARAVHFGVEASGRARVVPSITLEGSYAYARFTLDDFGVFSGNRLPGIPSHTGSVRVSWSARQRVDLYASLTAASGAFVNDANAEQADAYGVIGLGASYRAGHLRLFARADNVGDVRYTNRVQVNDAGGSYYYPAQGRNASAGVEVIW
jgi:iron complex outermembrane receptor protein